MIARDLRWAMGVISSLAIVACASRGDPASDGPIVGPDQPPAPPPATPSVTLSVLFIGNSLTYYNDLPATLSGIAASAGDRIHTEMVAGPRQTLMDHLGADGAAEAAIRRGGWNYVVLEEGSSGDSASRATLVDAVRQFDVLVRAAGARTALYMVWPPADRPEDFCPIGAAYADAAAAVEGVLLPAGAAWASVLQQNPGVELYDRDGAHPAPLGTYLAAITIYETLTGHDSRELSTRAVVNGVVLSEPANTIRLLQEAAHSAAAAGAGPACNTEVF